MLKPTGQATRSENRLAQTTAVWLLAAASLTTGCEQSRDEFLWMIGSHLFLIYAVSLAAILLLHRLHGWPRFLDVVKHIRTPASVAGSAVAVAGIWYLVSGIPELFGDPGPAMLSPFLGVMMLVVGIHLYRWSAASSATDKAAHAKVVTMTIGFIVGLVFIMDGGGAIGPG